MLPASAESTLPDHEPAPAEAPAWVDVRDLDDLLDEVEARLGNETRQALEMAWEDWATVVDENAFDHQVRIWPDSGRIETSSLAHDGDADAQPLVTGALDDDVTEAREKGRFIACKSEAQVNEALKTYGQQLYFWVDEHRHSAVDYAVTGTRYQPGFDVSDCAALIVLPDDLQAEYKALRKTVPALEARRRFVDWANAALTEFTAWSNGEVYSVEVRAFDRHGTDQGMQQAYAILGRDGTDATRDDLAAELSPALASPVAVATKGAPSHRSP